MYLRFQFDRPNVTESTLVANTWQYENGSIFVLDALSFTKFKDSSILKQVFFSEMGDIKIALVQTGLQPFSSGVLVLSSSITSGH